MPVTGYLVAGGRLRATIAVGHCSGYYPIHYALS
jgi:hypothetical protein